VRHESGQVCLDALVSVRVRVRVMVEVRFRVARVRVRVSSVRPVRFALTFSWTEHGSIAALVGWSRWARSSEAKSALPG